MSTGYPDTPITSNEADNFQTGAYVNALSEFILECDTPMTIAIQGDWGTGKTSMINMVDEKIKKEVASVVFNTWQYSQFNLGDALPVLMLNKLALTLTDKKFTADEIKRTLSKLGKMAVHLAAGKFTGGGDTNDDIFNFDEVESIVGIKNEFQKAIDSRAADTKRNRVVVFVDDLDRLEPQKAVELLEVLKVFLDCDKCIFVLAVDYSVVTQGVKAKYGQDMDSEKGKSFFDKIIQLPFKMPVAKYNIEGYLKVLMDNIWGSDVKITDDDVKEYMSIIENTIGKNPRSIKRVVNSFIIVEKVAKEQDAYKNSKSIKQVQKLLFLLLCIQLAWEKLYNYLIEKANDVIEKGIEAYVSDLSDDDCIGKIIHETCGDDESKLKTSCRDQMKDTILIYCDCVNQLAGAVDNGEEEVLNVLQYSAITSNDDRVVVRRRAQPMSLDKYIEENKDNPNLDWMICKLMTYRDEKGYIVEARERNAGSKNYIRLLDNQGRPIIDCVLSKSAGWEVDFIFANEKDKVKMMKEVSANYSEKVNKITEYTKKIFYVTGVKSLDIFEALMEIYHNMS